MGEAEGIAEFVGGNGAEVRPAGTDDEEDAPPPQGRRLGRRGFAFANKR